MQQDLRRETHFSCKYQMRKKNDRRSFKLYGNVNIQLIQMINLRFNSIVMKLLLYHHFVDDNLTTIIS